MGRGRTLGEWDCCIDAPSVTNLAEVVLLLANAGVMPLDAI